MTKNDCREGREANLVSLRPLRAEDLTGLRSWVNDPEVTRFLGGCYAMPETWEMTERRLDDLLRGDAGGVHFAVADPESGRYLGQCDLIMIDRAAQKAEIALVLARENAGRGLGTQAVRRLVRFAFTQMNLRRLYLKVARDNKSAIRCYEKCGFALEGVLREDMFADGAFRDVAVMGLMRGEWENAGGLSAPQTP